MDKIMSVPRAAEALYGEATDAAMVSLRRQCQNGTIRHAEKEGSRWYINMSREFPALFPPDDAPAPAQPVDSESARELADLFGRLSDVFGRMATT